MWEYKWIYLINDGWWFSWGFNHLFLGGMNHHSMGIFFFGETDKWWLDDEFGDLYIGDYNNPRGESRTKPSRTQWNDLEDFFVAPAMAKKGWGKLVEPYEMWMDDHIIREFTMIWIIYNCTWHSTYRTKDNVLRAISHQSQRNMPLFVALKRQ